MIVADGVQALKRNGEWVFDVEPEFDTYDYTSTYPRRVKISILIDWIRLNAPELLKEE